MNLSHFSPHATITLRSIEQEQRPDHKPKGLWVSVDGEDDWAAWCAAEEYGLAEHRHRITLKRDVLVLATPEDLLRFTDTYGEPLHRLSTDRGDAINWAKVAASYPGIVIAPYQWSLRLDRRTRRYYGWDCASGCIWDADTVESVVLAEAVPDEH